MSQSVVIEDEILEEIKIISNANISYWLEFWSDINHFNGEDKHTVQSDMLFYIRALTYYKQKADHVDELEAKRLELELMNEQEHELLKIEVSSIRQEVNRLKGATK